jgi:type VI secretion system protein ImpE
MNEEVKKHAADATRRGFLAELLCFAGNWDRADLQLDTMGHADPQAMMGLSLFRHLVRAEQARQQFFAEGRLPEFLGEPSDILRMHLEASIHLREGRQAEAADLLGQAEEKRPKPKGVCNGQPFEDFRDLDDLTAPFFEVLTSNGKYYWVPLERVELVEFRPPKRPRDLIWQRAHMVVTDGPDGEVYLPTLYAGTPANPDDRIRLGRLTDWQGGEGAPVRGVGRRMYLIGNEAVPALDIKEITFAERGA